jgi:broad specificity phosphatase PhoE
MAKTVELWRHAEADGDVLTPAGMRMAVEIGRRLQCSYDVLVSSGAQRATQTAACFLAGMGRTVSGGVTVNTGFRSSVEERWYSAARRAEGKDLEAFRKVDPDLVEHEATLIGGILRSMIQQLGEGGRALVVGHSPTNEVAVLGLTGQVIRPLAKGTGVRVVEEGGVFRIDALQ